MGGKGSGRPIKHKTEEERRQAILESKRKYNKGNSGVYGPCGYGVNSLRNYGNRIYITPKPLYVGE